MDAANFFASWVVFLARDFLFNIANTDKNIDMELNHDRTCRKNSSKAAGEKHMNQPWYIRLGWWICEKTNHLWTRRGWIYNGYYHRECRLCGRIVSEPLKEKNT
jgi:hypothetical protein